MAQLEVVRRCLRGVSAKTGKPYCFNRFYIVTPTDLGLFDVEITPGDRSAEKILCMLVEEEGGDE